MSKPVIVGNDYSAIRIFRDEVGCEIRFNSLIINCNEDAAQIIDLVLKYPPEEGIHRISKITNDDDLENNKNAVKETLVMLSEYGIPLSFWKEEWFK